MQTGRFVIFLGRNRSHPILAERDESGRDASVRMLLVQFVSPNRIELIQLIVQRVAAIFCYQDRVSVIHEGNVIKRSMVGVAQNNQGHVAVLAASVEVDTEDSAPRAARSQLRLYARAIICVTDQNKKEGPEISTRLE